MLACQVPTRVFLFICLWPRILFVAPFRLKIGFQRPDGRFEDRLLLR